MKKWWVPPWTFLGFVQNWKFPVQQPAIFSIFRFDSWGEKTLEFALLLELCTE